MTTTSTNERDRWFLGTFLRILARAGDTDGQLGVMEQLAPQGFSPPLHVHHREDTALLVLDGAITAVVGDERFELGPGGFVWLPETFRTHSGSTARPCASSSS